MRYGMYVESNMAALGRLYLAAEDGCIVRVSCGEAGEGDVLCVQEARREEAAGYAAAEFGAGLPSEEAAGYAGTEPEAALLRRAAEELAEYFAGVRQNFTVPVRAEGTDFQRGVWEALRRIPYGETRTYGEIAGQVGSPRGARAVGMACNRNPVMLFIPCHRVVGSNGKLVGFAGGIAMKEALLKLEQASKK